MKIISNKKKLQNILKKEKNLGFVPTMGAIHLGHISLVKKSREHNSKTLVSIFVNKPQFNRKSDYQKYPRSIKKDLNILKNNKVDYVYLPTHNQIYSYKNPVKIKTHPFAKNLCGKYRPGHFEAIIDVVNRFIKIIKPKKIYFGKKDLQQLILIKEYIIKNKIKTKVIGCKTIRDKNGIALSSRNLLLSRKEKNIASKVYFFLKKEKKSLLNGKTSLFLAKQKLFNLGVDKIEYLKILDINKISIPFKYKKDSRVFIAYYLRSTRLIDNI